MSRPTTPLGLSPRGSYVNLANAIIDSTPGSPTRGEKDRLKAEMEVQQSLLKQADGQEKTKKEEAGMPVASPGEQFHFY